MTLFSMGLIKPEAGGCDYPAQDQLRNLFDWFDHGLETSGLIQA